MRPPETQLERTTLAWRRTILSMIVAGLLCVRLAPSTTAALVAAATVCGAISLQLRRTLRRHPPHLADPLSALLATALTVVFGAVGVLFSLGH